MFIGCPDFLKHILFDVQTELFFGTNNWMFVQNYSFFTKSHKTYLTELYFLYIAGYKLHLFGVLGKEGGGYRRKYCFVTDLKNRVLIFNIKK